MSDRGWVLVDAIVALALLATALGLLAPALQSLGALQAQQEARIYRSLEERGEDPWARFR